MCDMELVVETSSNNKQQHRKIVKIWTLLSISINDDC